MIEGRRIETDNFWQKEVLLGQAQPASVLLAQHEDRRTTAVQMTIYMKILNDLGSLFCL